MRHRGRLGLLLLGAVGLLLVSATSAGAANYILRPNADAATQWTEVPAGSGWTKLDDAVLQPTVPGTGTDYITKSGGAATSAVRLTTQTMSAGEVPVSARMWVYFSGGPADLTLTPSDGYGRLSLGAGTPAGWQTLAVPISTQQQVDDVSLLFDKISLSGTTASIYAAYVDLTTTTVVPPAPDLPTPPQPYTVPGGAVSVDTSAELISELASSPPQDIILENGAYTTPGSSPFVAATGHRLWARNLGGATLNAGLGFFGNFGSGGGEVHGLAFEVTDPAKATYPNDPNTAMLFAAGPSGLNTKVYDTTFEGDPGTDHRIDAGILMRQPQGGVIQRVEIRDVKLWGARVQVYGSPYDSTAQANTIKDVYADGVALPIPGSGNGTSEAGLWIGAPVTNPVERLQLEHGGWMGLWTGASSKDTTFRDITISSTDKPDGGTGIYAERRSLRNTYEQFSLGPNIAKGVACEYDQGTAIPGCDDSTFQDGLIDSSFIGVELDDGQRSNVVQRVIFRNQSCAGILDYDLSPPPPTTDTYADNDFSGIDPGAQPIFTSHRNSCP